MALYFGDSSDNSIENSEEEASSDDGEFHMTDELSNLINAHNEMFDEPAPKNKGRAEARVAKDSSLQSIVDAYNSEIRDEVGLKKTFKKRVAPAAPHDILTGKLASLSLKEEKKRGAYSKHSHVKEDVEEEAIPSGKKRIARIPSKTSECEEKRLKVLQKLGDPRFAVDSEALPAPPKSAVYESEAPPKPKRTYTKRKTGEVKDPVVPKTPRKGTKRSCEPCILQAKRKAITVKTGSKISEVPSKIIILHKNDTGKNTHWIVYNETVELCDSTTQTSSNETDTSDTSAYCPPPDSEYSD
jgi:hypothetical protein